VESYLSGHGLLETLLISLEREKSIDFVTFDFVIVPILSTFMGTVLHVTNKFKSSMTI